MTIEQVADRRRADRRGMDLPTVAPVRPSGPEWGSDVVAEMLQRLGVEYVAVMPGASFRGLHDSLVNYGANERPALILTNHEGVAVAIAHGYAKVAGRPMAAAVHSTVGLMQASMTIFCAWCDRQPVLILGGTGPMDATARRPWIDWIHTAHGQGELVRDFTKWENQPASVEAFPEAMVRAWHIAQLEPPGPVYVCLDVTLQEQKLAKPLSLDDVAIGAAPVAGSPSPDAVRRTADLLAGADRPLLLLGRTGPSAEDWSALIALAEAVGAAVVTDGRSPAAFPSDHPLHQGMTGASTHATAVEAIKEADVIVALDRLDLAGVLRERQGRPARLVNVTLEPYATRSWSADYQELPRAELAIAANPGLTVSALREAVDRALLDAPSARRKAEDRARLLAERSRRRDDAERAERSGRRSSGAIQMDEVLAALRHALGDRAPDAIVAFKGIGPWPALVWPFSKPLSFLGGDGGGGIGSGSGIAVGAALAARDLGRTVIAVLGDGELLAAPTALWTAAHHEIPILVVVGNNQSYYNDEEHQRHMARVRSRPEENRWIGQRMERPPVDYAVLARGLGVPGFGPVQDRADLEPTLRRALAHVAEGGPALVDVRIAPR